MLMFFSMLTLTLISVIILLFFLASKSFYWEEMMSSSFECGFTSYFFSRYSFSMHYFLIGMMFLFLDLELCFIMPFFNGDISSFSSYFIFYCFVLVLILGILTEWVQGKMEWKF